MENQPAKKKPMRVFLSHATKDRKTADILRTQLREAGFDVWSMGDDVLPGDNWGEAVANALETSDAMVALVSPSFVSSEHAGREVEFALTQPRYRDRLIPVMIRPTNRFPWILKNLSFIDATRNPEAAGAKVISALSGNLQKRPAGTNA